MHRQPPTSIQSRLQQAVSLHRAGRLDEAAALYADVIRLHHQHPDALHFSGLLALQQGRWDRGIELIRRSIAVSPSNAGAHANLGRAFMERQRTQDALDSFERALRINPDMPDVLNLRGNALLDAGRPADALQSYDRALQLNAGFSDAWNNRGNALLQLGRAQDALSSYEHALQLQPNCAELLNNRGALLLDLGRPTEALHDFDQALALRPQYADALYNRGNALRALSRYEEALQSYDRVLTIKPQFLHALTNRGLTLQSLQRTDEACACFARVLELDPSSHEALNNLGNIYLDLQRPEEALERYEQALVHRPDAVDALNNRGNALMRLERISEALLSYEHALERDPANAEALNNRGNALLTLRRTQEALTCYMRALHLHPGLADAHYNAGNALSELRRFDEALERYREALRLRPDFPDALESCGSALSALRRHEEAAECFAQLVHLAPTRDYALGNLARARMHCCDWAEIDALTHTISTEVGRQRRAALPGDLLAFCDDPVLQLQCARTFIAHKHPQISPAPRDAGRSERSRLRIAYVSADFYAHATAHLLAEVFERHDRTRFETYAISIGRNVMDAMRDRLEKCFDQFIDAHAMSDRELAEWMCANEVDIAVDLKGFTAEARPGIFARRPAPVQVSYLGYPGTMGAEYIDYLIADRTIIPAASFQHYAERIVHLPDCYQPNDSRRAVAQYAPTRAAVGLPNDAFVFCSFNNSYKITPTVFDIWMRLLLQTPGSVLWLLEWNGGVANNLRREAHLRGVDPDRLIFAARTGIEAHLARHRLADLFLDTFPCNAHTTASDALWAGLPVLTRIGGTFAGRVAASLLHAIGLSELVTQSTAEYEALALHLATRPKELSELRNRLQANRLTSGLFDADRVRLALERAYEQMWTRWSAGLPPDHIVIDS